MVTAGGHPTGGHLLDQPTVIDQVPSGAVILGTASSGRWRQWSGSLRDDVVRWANNTEFGLVSYVYTQTEPGPAVSEALEAGMVGLNAASVSDPGGAVGGVNSRASAARARTTTIWNSPRRNIIATNW